MSKVITLSLNPIDANFDESINDFICKKLNSKNIKKDQFNADSEEIDYKDLITKLREIKSKIALLEKTIFK